MVTTDAIVDATGMLGRKKRHRNSAIEPFEASDELEKFIRDVWSQSTMFPNKEWFEEWHVGKVCREIQECIEIKKNYACIMPRGHLKSTICHGLATWMMFRSEIPPDPMYESYNDKMSQKHVGNIKKAILTNPVLSPHFVDLTARSPFAFRCLLDGKPSTVNHGGILAFNRGEHTNSILIADDILKDPDDPVQTSVIQKIEEQFLS